MKELTKWKNKESNMKEFKEFQYPWQQMGCKPAPSSNPGSTWLSQLSSELVPSHKTSLPPWLVSTNSVKATAEQHTNNGYWLEQYTTFMGNIKLHKVHLMRRTHGKEPQEQISSSVYPQPSPSGSNTCPNPVLLVPRPHI